MASESSLINLSFFGSAEGHAVALEFEHSLGGFTAHVMDSILITQPVTALDRVVGMPAPVVFSNVAEGGIDASLSGNGVTTGREEFSDTGGLVTLFYQAKSGAESGTTSTDDDGIIGMINNVVGGSQRSLRWTGIRSLLGNHGKTFFIEKRSFVQAS